MKKCSKCLVEKDLHYFPWRIVGIKRRNICKACKAFYMKIYVNKNRNKKRDSNKKWIKNNPECRRKIARKQYLKNREKNLEYNRAYNIKNRSNISKRKSIYGKENRYKTNNLNALYRSRKKNATPAWLSDHDIYEIKIIYTICWALKKVTGINYTVDHIYPLKSDVVCGLHIPSNLRIITQSQNSSKSNKLINIDHEDDLV